MPSYPVYVRDPAGEAKDESFAVMLSSLPARGRGLWLRLDDGTAAQVEEIWTIGGEPVLFAARRPGIPATARIVKTATRQQ